MKDPSKTKQELVKELSVLKQKINKLEKSETKHKQAEEALRQSEEKYRTILENIQEGYFELDLAGNYTFANEANCRYLGYTKEELVGMNFRQHTDKETAKKFRQPFQELYRTGKPINTLEAETIRKDGTKAIYETSVSLIRDNEGKPIGFRGVSRDVTKRKNMEEALRQSEERYRAIIENIEDGYFEVDLTGTFTFVNDAQCRNVGTPREQLLGMNNRDYTSEEEAKKLYQLFIGIYRTGEPVKGFAFEYKKRDGTMAFVEMSVSLIRDIEGKPIGFRGISRDITERKQVEEALKKSEEMLRLITENMSDMIRVTDLQGVNLYSSPSHFKGLGYKMEERVGKSTFDIVHPDDIERCISLFSEGLASIQDGLASNQRISAEYRIKHADGHYIWLETVGDILRDAQGKPTAIVESSRNISERKLAEEALRESEEKYRLVVENAKEAIIIAQDLKLVFFNRAAMEMIEYAGDISEPKAFIDFIHPDDRNMVVDHHIRRLKGEEVPFAYSFRIFGEDGTIKWVEFNTAVIQWKGRPATLNFLNDITERKQVEEALRESEARYRLLADNMADAVWLMDMNLNVTYTSPSVEKLIGYTDEEIKQGTPEKFLTPESLNKAMAVFSEEVVKAKADPSYSPIRTLELEFCRKDGTTYWSESNFSFIRDEKGIPVSILGEARDITERKRAEEEKRRLEERLQRAYKMEAIGTLAGGIAHDFNNLLMGIQGYASLALLNINQDDPNYEKLKLIEEQVQSGADLTRQLLGFARGGRYEVKPADINDVIQETSSMFGRTKKEITIHTKYEKNLCSVEVDLGQMEQVFMNLYVNAWQAMPGGGNIYLETENVFLNDEQALSYSVKPGKYVKITVTDTGTGMDEKTRKRIFEPFFTTKEMGRGTGLGLATVYGIIKGHKGMINVYSELGHGTTFTIYLPASEKEVVKKETATGTIDRGTETILLVDDEKMVLKVSKELLESLGYRVYAVGSGQEAIALFMGKREEIDLVILDMIMPGISGGETFDRLREINPEIKVLLSSGYSLNGEAQTIMDSGCKGFIQKPFQVEKLSQKVREMLD